MKTIPLEIERKFLIKMPAPRVYARGTTWKIIQTYLTPLREGENRRVRFAESRGERIYTMTTKRRKTSLTCFEREELLTREDYYAHLTEARPDSAPVEKIRHAVPYHGHLLEIDIYPFWRDYAILEIELEQEDEGFHLPDEITVVREVTDDPRYKNTNIARFLHDHPGEPLPIE